MKPSEADNQETVPPLWQVVPMTDYQVPAAPVAESVKRRLAVFRRLFFPGEVAQESFTASNTLKALPERHCERLVPFPDWNAAADALTLALQDWLAQEKPGTPVIGMIGPPHGGHPEILAAWAAQNGWPLLPPPSTEQILTGDDAWLSGCGGADGAWVVPALERAYLRHPEGLNLIRRFLDRACAGDLGRGIIGCDSWAWAFLNHVWRGRLPVTLALQACDKARLSDHFRQWADVPSCDGWIRFRQSDNGRPVLDDQATDPADAEPTTFLQLLAAHSRGILGVARAVWRAGLQTEPDETLAAIPPESDAQRADRRTVWVLPWNQHTFPALPSGAGRDEAFVLHTLLLHNGLPSETMQGVLPLSSSQVMEILLRLADAGLVVRDHAAWRVAPQGYPAVRQFLQGNGYLLDQF